MLEFDEIEPFIRTLFLQHVLYKINIRIPRKMSYNWQFSRKSVACLLF